MHEVPHAIVPPVVVIGFRRLDTLQRVLSTAAEHHQGQIYVFLDGARDGRQDDVLDCTRVRDWVSEFAKCHLNVTTSFSDRNIGCGRAVPAAINWVLDSGHESLIVLEDDCLPSPSFFPFMYQLLARYADDKRVTMISGNQFLPDEIISEYSYSYYYSRFIHTWGWATWKRAWALYDHEMSALDDRFTHDNIKSILPNRDERSLYVRWWLRQRENPHDTAWDSRWMLALLLARGACICPSRNLIRNIGFGTGSTHTARCSRYQVIPRQTIDFPLRHPPTLTTWERADRWWFTHLHSRNLFSRLRRYMLRINADSVIDDVK